MCRYSSTKSYVAETRSFKSKSMMQISNRGLHPKLDIIIDDHSHDKQTLLQTITAELMWSSPLGLDLKSNSHNSIKQ